MPVGECLKKLSHRQYLVMLEWLRKEWNNPSRTDYYLMQVAQRCQQIMREDANKISMDGQKIDFVFEVQKEPSQITEDQQKKRVASSKAIWKSLIGGKRGNKRRRS